MKRSWLFAIALAAVTGTATADDQQFKAGTTVKGKFIITNWSVLESTLEGNTMLALSGEGDCKLIGRAKLGEAKPVIGGALPQPFAITVHPEMLACTRANGATVTVQVAGSILPTSFQVFDFKDAPDGLEFIVAKSVNY